jgi:ketosteroid isomerase-like protein
MDKAERQEIEQACIRLINRYANLGDAQDWDAVAGLYTEDATMRRPSGGDPVVGREAILAAFKARPPRAQRHAVSNIVVDVEDSATARAFSVILLFQGEAAAPGELPEMSANSPVVGWYRDLIVQTSDGWKFAERVGGLDFRP